MLEEQLEIGNSNSDMHYLKYYDLHGSESETDGVIFDSEISHSTIDPLRNAGFKTNNNTLYYKIQRVNLDYENFVCDTIPQKETKKRKEVSKMPSFASLEEQLHNNMKLLPEKQRIELLTNFMTQVQTLIDQPPTVIEESTTLPPLLSPFEILKQNYTPFPEGLKMSATNVLNHLEKELAGFVKEYGADQNYIFLKEFREIEPRAESIYRRLWKSNKKDKSVKLLSQIIPKQVIKSKKENELKSNTISDLDLSRNISFTKSYSTFIASI